MTLEEFEDNIKRKTQVERKGYLIQCMITAVFGLMCSLYTVSHTDKLGRFHVIPIGISLYVLFIGCYGYYKLKNKYKLVSYYDLHPVDIKRKAIENILERLPITYRSTAGNTYFFTYQKNKWSIDYDVDLFYDSDQVSFVTIGRGFRRGGLIDFGRSERKKRLLLDQISIELNGN